MPVIPGFQGGQILNAGSPVPIASASKAAVGAGALEQFGDALGKVAGALDQASRAANAQKQRLDVEESMNAFRDQALMAEMQQQQQPLIADDIDGTKTFSAFKDRLKSPMEEIAGRIANPETRRAFMNDAAKITTESSLRIYAKDVVRRTAENKSQMGGIISQYSNQAFNDPSKIEEGMIRAQSLIQGDTDLLPDAKAQYSKSAQKDIVSGAYLGELERGNFDGANKILESYAGVFDDTEEVAKLRMNVEKRENRFYAQLSQQQAQEERALVREQKKKAAAAENKFKAVLLGGTPEEVMVAKKMFMLEADAGEIDPKRAQLIMATADVRKRLNQAFVGDLTQQLAYGKIDPDKALDQLRSLPPGEVSYDYSMSLENGFYKLQQSIEADPSFRQKMKAGEDKINALKNTLVLKGNSAAQKYQNSSVVGKMVSQYYTALATNTSMDLDPAVVADAVLRDNGVRFSNRSAQDIRAEMEKVDQDYQKNPAKSKAAEKEVVQRLRKLQSELTLIQSKDAK